MSKTLELGVGPSENETAAGAFTSAEEAVTNTEITINVSDKLLKSIDRLADDMANNIGDNLALRYFEYYLNFQAHLNGLYTVGSHLGINEHHRVLEVGSGMGTRCVLGNAIWRAKFTGLEPCANSYGNLHDAILEFKSGNSQYSYEIVEKPGEDTGLTDSSFDFIVCFEVMEHVQDYEKVISEMMRVLKPGGKIYISTSNYFSFYEGHYRCFWLPFLNRKRAESWIRMLGYNPAFLNEVNFLKKTNLIRALHSANFKDIRFGFPRTQANPPNLTVNRAGNSYTSTSMPPPAIKTRYLQEFIQREYVQRFLSHFNMECKIYLTATK